MIPTGYLFAPSLASTLPLAAMGAGAEGGVEELGTGRGAPADLAQPGHRPEDKEQEHNHDNEGPLGHALVLPVPKTDSAAEPE